MVIPPQTIYTIEHRSKGYPAWAVQRALNDLGFTLVEDGYYGRKTEGAVATFQEDEGLLADGIFGPASSERLARVLEALVPATVPKGLIHGLVSGESGDLIGAVNWSVAGGVDCGYCQRRVYSADFSKSAICKRAFDGLYQMKLLGSNLKGRHDAFFGRAGASTHKRAWRLATLHHNYQYAAEQLSWGPWETPYSTSPQNWVVQIGAEFPDGSTVDTPLDWCRYYMDRMTRFVEDWTP